MKGSRGSRLWRLAVQGRKPRGGRPQLELLEARCLLATFIVNSNLDEADANPGDGICETATPGVCTLRAAIEEANLTPGPDTIEFAITGGNTTIGVGSTGLGALPAITSPLTINGTTQAPTGGVIPRVVLDGSLAGATSNGLQVRASSSSIQALAIVGFGGSGIVIDNVTGVSVTGSHIGVNAAGVVADGNGEDGIRIIDSVATTIGATASGARNVIGGNTGAGIAILGSSSEAIVIQNTFIGTDTGSSLDLGNGGDGVLINAGSNNTIGGAGTSQASTIAFNGGAGVKVLSGPGNAVLRSRLYQNDVGSIDLSPGANEDIPAPVLSAVSTSGGMTRATGTLTGAKPNTPYTIEFFASPDLGMGGLPQARTYLGSLLVTTDASGAALINFATTTVQQSGVYLTATATENGQARNTSELANAVQNVTTTNLVVDGSVMPSPAAQGGYITYTFTVRNAGLIPANTTFSDSLPSSLNFVQATSTQGVVNRTGNVVTVNLGELAPGATATITILTTALTLGSIINTGTATSPEDPNGSDNTRTLTVNVVQGIDLNVQASALPTPGQVGQDLVFQYVVTNQGATTATNVTVLGTFPTGVPYVTATTSQGTITANATTGQFTANVGDLAIGASALIRVVLRPSATGTLSSSAMATGNQPETFTGNNSAMVSVAVNNAIPIPGAQAPVVTSLRRFGRGTKPSSLAVVYSRPMEPATVENLVNYQLVTAGKDQSFNTADDVPIALASATYNTTTREVVLTTRRPYSLHQEVQLTINGTSETAVADLDGQALDGSYSGEASSNFQWRFKAYGPGPITGPQELTTPGRRFPRRFAGRA